MDRSYGTTTHITRLQALDDSSGRWTDRDYDGASYRRLLDVIDWVQVDDPIAEQAGALANQYLRSHPEVDPIDYIIAATAQALDADLRTTSLKHVPMFPQLTSPY